MTTAELQNRIYCWLWLYQNIVIKEVRPHAVIIFGDGYPFHWLTEMLVDVASLNIPNEIKGTLIEEDLRLAIQFAKSGDCDLINHIGDLLKNVNAAIVRYRPQCEMSVN